MKPALSGRADLIRALALRDLRVTEQMAALLGYEEAQTLPRPPLSPERAPQPGQPAPAPAYTSYVPADVPFWRLDAYEAVASDAHPPESERVPDLALGWQGRPGVVPGFTPLASQQAILTRLRQLAVIRRVIPEVDVDKVVDRISRGLLLTDIPRRQRRSWGATLHILEDRARRLVPYWLDQEYVSAALCRLYPPHGVTIARLDDGDSQPYVRWPVEQAGPYTLPPPGTMVFVLGDLGCLASRNQHLQRFWLTYGRRLQDNHNPTVALVPTRMRDVPPALARVWTLVRWDAMSEAAEVPSEGTDTAMERLLALVAPVVRLEPGLLRAMRCLLPAGRHDPGLEARLWQDETIASPHSVAATLDPERRRMYQQHFAHLPQDVRRLALDLVRQWRAALNEAVWFGEIGELDAESQHDLIDPVDLQDAERFFESLTAWVSSQETLPADIAACFSRMTGRFSPAAAHNPVIRRAFHVMLQRIRPPETVVEVPVWYDPADLPSAGGSIRKVELWQVADQVCLQAAASSTLDGLEPVHRGSRLGLVETVSGEVTLALEPPEPAPLPQAWTNAIGMEFVLIPAGTFLMGSPTLITRSAREPISPSAFSCQLSVFCGCLPLAADS